MSDVTFDMNSNNMAVHRKNAEDWKVTLIDTGLNTLTGGRLKRVAQYLDPETPFCFTYGDGVSDVNISELIAFHEASNKLATVTAVIPPGRYGALEIKDGIVSSFFEKPKGDGSQINGGFFVLSPRVIEYISGDDTSWEGGATKAYFLRELAAFRHRGFWQPMDTLREKNLLQDLWDRDLAPWKVVDGDQILGK